MSFALWPLLSPEEIIPLSIWKENFVGPRGSLDAAEKRKISASEILVHCKGRRGVGTPPHTFLVLHVSCNGQTDRQPLNRMNASLCHHIQAILQVKN
jgi:hypothetical protein